MPYYRLWWILVAVLTVTFGILGFYGSEIYRQAPPIPAQVVTTSGETLMTSEDVMRGQSAWQSIGGMQLGSIWGHGAYQAPDWSADWLHRELMAWLDLAVQEEHGTSYEALPEELKAAFTYRLKQEYRRNTYDAGTGTLTVSDRRAQAMEQTAAHYLSLFGDTPELRALRNHYAMKENTLPDAERRQHLVDFFFWTAWVTATERPDQRATYTNNWPPEPLIGNYPTTENVLWSLASIVLLVAGVGALIWGYAFLRRHDDEVLESPDDDPIQMLPLTPSQKALGKYLFVVFALLTFQVFMGGAYRPLYGGRAGVLRH